MISDQPTKRYEFFLRDLYPAYVAATKLGIEPDADYYKSYIQNTATTIPKVVKDNAWENFINSPDYQQAIVQVPDYPRLYKADFAPRQMDLAARAAKAYVDSLQDIEQIDQRIVPKSVPKTAPIKKPKKPQSKKGGTTPTSIMTPLSNISASPIAQQPSVMQEEPQVDARLDNIVQNVLNNPMRGRLPLGMKNNLHNTNRMIQQLHYGKAAKGGNLQSLDKVVAKLIERQQMKNPTGMAVLRSQVGMPNSQAWSALPGAAFNQETKKWQKPNLNLTQPPRPKQSASIASQRVPPNNLMPAFIPAMSHLSAFARGLNLQSFGPIGKRGLPIFLGRFVDPQTGRIRVLPKPNMLVNPTNHDQVYAHANLVAIYKWNQFARALSQVIKLSEYNPTQWNKMKTEQYQKKAKLSNMYRQQFKRIGLAIIAGTYFPYKIASPEDQATLRNAVKNENYADLANTITAIVKKQLQKPGLTTGRRMLLERFLNIKTSVAFQRAKLARLGNLEETQYKEPDFNKNLKSPSNTWYTAALNFTPDVKDVFQNMNRGFNTIRINAQHARNALESGVDANNNILISRQKKYPNLVGQTPIIRALAQYAPQ